MADQPTHPVVRALRIAAEVLLVLAILGLLVLIWMPALIGPHAGVR